MLQPTIGTLSSKGQIVIPTDFRKFLDLKPKMKMLIWSEPEQKRVVLEPFIEDPVKAGLGLLSDWKKSATQIMRETRKEEKKHETTKAKKLNLR
jgi:bifunctional DNA-binding transcriptional regulator/antitoxin component of YhaV-PrlF toxin-antitoxin module